MKYVIICCIALILIIVLCALIKKIVRICKGKHYKPQHNSCRQVRQFNKELYPSGFAYDSEKDIFYSLKDAWQRNYGYRDSYDEMASYFNMIIDREPIKFDYKDRHWMIEMWKGQYGLAAGGEVGIYVSDDGTNYRCVSEDEEIGMGMTLIKNRKILVQRYDRHWWLTGFKFGEYCKPKNLIMVVDFELYDSRMCLAVVNELIRMGYNEQDFMYYNNILRIRFDVPFTKRQKSRRRPMAHINMMLNKHSCRLYRKYTKKYRCTLDKIGYIRIRIPHVYKMCLKVLSIWKRIND